MSKETLMSALLVRELRERTGAGILDCKKALQKTDGTIDEAIKYLRINGVLRAETRSGRTTAEGIVYSYIHHDNKTGVLLELNCETDFVAMNSQFTELAHNLAMHIVACRPLYTSRDMLPRIDEVLERELHRSKTLAEGKPAHIVDKIVDGRMQKFYKTTCLLDQQYILDDSMSVDELIKSYVSKIGENIVIKQFAVFVVGEKS
jgi:elongation factor Ts